MLAKLHLKAELAELPRVQPAVLPLYLAEDPLAPGHVHHQPEGRHRVTHQLLRACVKVAFREHEAAVQRVSHLHERRPLVFRLALHELTKALLEQGFVGDLQLLLEAHRRAPAAFGYRPRGAPRPAAPCNAGAPTPGCGAGNCGESGATEPDISPEAIA